MQNKLCNISVFFMIIAGIYNLPAEARINNKTNGRSYADAYNQVYNIRQQNYLDSQATVTTASATDDLPVAVDDAELRAAILNNSSNTVNISKLEQCSMIFPSGNFRWGVPQSGLRPGSDSQCIAVVQLIDSNSNKVIATTTVAAGDSIKCNIDSFPVSGHSTENIVVELPNDREPTMEDVEAIMNEEQKQNAGIKIAAGSVISAIAANMLAPKEAGDTKLLGTSKTQLVDTAIGAVSGAAITAASTYSGKVAGDTIKSTAVNAASGMVLGNMYAGASGDGEVLYVTKCNVPVGETKEERDCVIGKITSMGEKLKFTEGSEEKDIIYLINRIGNVLKCVKDKSSNDDNDTELNNCSPYNNITNVTIYIDGKTTIPFDFQTTKQNDLSKQRKTYTKNPNDNKYTLSEHQLDNVGDGEYFKVASGFNISATSPAYAVLTNLNHKAFGYKKEDWAKLVASDSGIKYYQRYSSGEVGNEIILTTLKDEKSGNTPVITQTFTPSTKDASDGGIVDISNEARAKGTIAGTAVGGAIGGFAGYQGAKSELSERWTEAVGEYKDSLTKFVCVTGTRYLAQYNDYAEIPELKEESEE